MHPDTPVIYMTGYADDDLAYHRIRTGEVVLLPKPFRPDELLDRVGQVLDDRQP